MADQVVIYNIGKTSNSSTEYSFIGANEEHAFSFPTMIRIPRYTSTQRNSLSNPQPGWLILNTTDGRLEYFSGTSWKYITGTVV